MKDPHSLRVVSNHRGRQAVSAGWIGNSKKLEALQTSYAESEAFGLEEVLPATKARGYGGMA